MVVSPPDPNASSSAGKPSHAAPTPHGSYPSMNQPSISDPTGAWQNFLSASGTPATSKDVDRFFKILMQTFDTMIKADDAAHKKSMQHLKEVSEGND